MRFEVFFDETKARQVKTVADENPCDRCGTIQAVEDVQAALCRVLDLNDPQVLGQQGHGSVGVRNVDF